MNTNRAIDLLNIANNNLDDIEITVSESLGSIDGALDDIELDISDLLTSVETLESDVSEIKKTIADIGVTIAKNTSTLQQLRSDSDAYFSRGDHTSDNQYLYWENITGDAVNIKKIFMIVNTAGDLSTWEYGRLFDLSDGSGVIALGSSTTSNNIDKEIFSFGRNYILFGNFKSSSVLSNQTETVFEFTDVNLKIPSNEYIVARASYDSSGGKALVCLNIEYETST